MKRPALLTTLAVTAAVIGWAAMGPSVVRGAEQSWTGKISDSLCGMSHDGMRKKGDNVTDRECTVACINYQTPGAPTFVFVSGGKVYPIKNQTFGGLGRRSGATIVLTGELGSDGGVTITKIEEAKR